MTPKPTEATPRRVFDVPTWRYHAKHGAKLFKVGDEKPGDDWLDHPVEVAKPKASPAVEAAPGSGMISLADHERALEDQAAKFNTAWDKLEADRDALADAVEALKAKLAKFDPDGDGNPGGGVSDTEDEATEKAEIREKLKALGVQDPHHKTGLPKLRELLAAAEAKGA